jgi:Asp-tRNA(Asn)/Glu-tRNA(Gln) amidotransferase A subunit family amidase
MGAEELLDAYLDRVDRLNPQLNAVVVRVDEEARSGPRRGQRRWRPATSWVRCTAFR